MPVNSGTRLTCPNPGSSLERQLPRPGSAAFVRASLGGPASPRGSRRSTMWFSRFLANSAETIDKKRGWSRLPLAARASGPDRAAQTPAAEEPLRHRPRGRATRRRSRTGPGDYHGARTLDGTYNDLDDPLMGSIGSRFGRNVPLETPGRSEPPSCSIRTRALISRELLTRETFQPATTLNLLAGAWIQFEVHDWFSHGEQRPEHPWEIPLDRRRPVARAPDADRPHAARPEHRAGQAADVRRPPTRTGGTARRSTATRRSSPTRSGRTSSAS